MVKNIAKVYKKTYLHQQGNDFSYWQTRPYAERIAVLEEIRHEYQAWEQSTRGDTDHVQPGFQRVYRIIKR